MLGNTLSLGSKLGLIFSVGLVVGRSVGFRVGLLVYSGVGVLVGEELGCSLSLGSELGLSEMKLGGAKFGNAVGIGRVVLEGGRVG